ncbi:MAG: cob(I)yrinic acid a,c-diamide adenosyltransferase [Bacteroidota bacterium]
MKVYTKTGDKGTTSLLGGTRVSKGDLRIEAYGTVDELNSWMGLLRDESKSDERIALIAEVQERLFTLGSHLALDDDQSKIKVPDLNQEDIKLLEDAMDTMDESLPPLKNFVLPGGAPQVSHAHIARCVCRRAERQVILLADEVTVADLIIQYLNRLSDYLFMLSRMIAVEVKAEEIPWKPRG